MAGDTLSSDSLEWALTHISKFGDTDIFPVPFEFKSIRHGCNRIKSELEKSDLTTYRTRGSRRLLVPKPGGGFRVVTQLDPIDAIIYAAIAYEAAPGIENNRVPRDRAIACSYRLDLNPKGQLFASETGWPDFHVHSKHLADKGFYSHVLLADIADFYNQIYSHRVQSALEAANASPARANNVERFLLSLTAKQSRGVPVGPSGSILLAEAVLTDVDNFLLRLGAPFTRFVDDFRIFCTSKREAVRIHHDLAEYVYTSHRLILEPWKTRIVPIRHFIDQELVDPSEIERSSKVQKIRSLLDQILFESGYSVAEDDLLDQDKDRAVRENLIELLEECVSRTPLHLGVARYLLRRATRLRTTALHETIFKNLPRLDSVFRDVILYLIVGVPKKVAALRGQEIVEFLRCSDYGQIPFLRLWGMELFERRPDMLGPDAALDLATEFRKDLGTRTSALAARAAKKVDWVRGQKEIWANYSPWDRRAVIYSGSVLPPTERRIWLDMIAETSDDILEQAVAKFSKEES
jgi:hypothetical protein